MTIHDYYSPTHLSTRDGSDAMLVRSEGRNCCVMRNENGDEWSDHPDLWKSIDKAPTEFDMGWEKAGE